MMNGKVKAEYVNWMIKNEGIYSIELSDGEICIKLSKSGAKIVLELSDFPLNIYYSEEE